MRNYFFLVALALFVSSCSNDTAPTPQPKEEVEFTLDFSFAESGNMTRASGEEVYSDFYETYIKSKKLTPTTYSLTFTNKETGAVAKVNGNWSKKDGIRLLEGEYEVSGTSSPIGNDFKECSDSVFLKFNETVAITKDDERLNLTAQYNSFLILFNAENLSQISCNNNAFYSSKRYLSQDDSVFWIFMRDTYYNGNKNNYYTLEILRNDGQTSSINLIDIPFEKGKYYYFNDMTNSFDIPQMEAGN